MKVKDEKLFESKFKELTWWHTLKLGNVITDGHSVAQFWTLFNLPEDYINKRVLDVGCADGFFAFNAEDKGALEVVMLDDDDRPTRNLLLECLETKVKFVTKDILIDDLTNLGKFDVILFLGVLYHLKYPLLGLEKITKLLNPDGEIYVETIISLDTSCTMRFIEDSYANDYTNWWMPSVECVLALMRTAGFKEVLFKDYNDMKTRAIFWGKL